ncbi:MAG: hypothetical protein IH901_08055, partial [Proteobacteria bacterium]|nr:hypothetical protein [Pseudomonadota bacterium]
TFPDGETITEEDQDGDGVFLLTGLPEGTYFMAITPQEGEPIMTVFYAPEEGQVGVEYDTVLDPQPRIYIDGVNVALLEAAQPITVGPKDKVGTETAGKKIAKGLGKSLVGGLFGGGGSSRRSSAASGPKTKKDPARKMDEVAISDPASGVVCEVRTRWTDDGLLVSTHIDKHSDKGTFQTVYLMDEYGNQLPTSRIEVYKIWAKHTLTVSWTKSSYVNGNLVSQESGGWVESWTEDLGTFKRRVGADGFAAIPPIWALSGYDRAHAGVRRVGAYFQLTPEAFQQARKLYLVIHITMPKADPVMTTPLIMELTPGADGAVVASPVVF